MTPVRQKRIRAILRARPNGMTPIEIAEVASMHPANVRTALRAMPDVYVDRWRTGKRGQYEKACTGLQNIKDLRPTLRTFHCSFFS